MISFAAVMLVGAKILIWSAVACGLLIGCALVIDHMKNGGDDDGCAA